MSAAWIGRIGPRHDTHPLHAAAPAAMAGRNRIVIRRLALNACIGVHDWEHAAPQPVLIDLEFTLPDACACASDQLADTIDYAIVVQRLRSIALEQPHRLVEAMAETMAKALMREFGIPWLMLGLTKLAPFPGAEVGIVIERDASALRDVVSLPVHVGK